MIFLCERWGGKECVMQNVENMSWKAFSGI